ncbi:MAG: GntR family transcriptional regulator [Streptosporangiales bacterium]|nr:GntR family transcriptional regulator [Streptosporangiales bacterium]MBO0892264.1 GntR family transcriptional regulator [Acidothermales bacterium]
MSVPVVSVDRSSPVPLYFQVASQLEDAIRSETLPPGSRLDNEIQLARRLGLSRPTVRQAIGYLVDRGLLVRRRGVGTQVVHSKVRRPLELTSLYDDLGAAGAMPTTTVHRLDEVDADPTVADALAVSPGTRVVRLERVRHAEGRPLALMTNHLPTGLLDLDVPALEAKGLYQLLRENGVHPHLAKQAIGARTASAREAAALGERRGAALLTMTRVAYATTGQAVEYGAHVYRASRYTFELTLVER